MIKLTHKQEQFVLGLIEGKSQRKAYIDAGYSTKGKSEQDIDTLASKLAKNNKVYTRFEELRQEVAEKSKWTRQKAFEEYEWLKNMAKADIEVDGVKKATADAFISSLDGMNRMTFGNEMLVNKKIATEIKMLEKKIDQLDKGDAGQEDKIKKLHDAITEVITSE
ncbi:terminase [Staphylococcus delphini]|uniref:terminase small subunit n=1 Tax=Staphylococcus delphini TaxID=53344 RepID=UPI000BBCA488|nr:terminase small subunit [Staphylococcus delphini]ELD8170512.1 terminase small subunit [Staphylococcus pseudintermedius]PCF70794.1 terminase [Staphylococcus delphini]PCF81452.1 terminase [Staphylococcus delphini]HAR6508687.1 terminase [Staphylococcus pseudintermedius]HDU1427106.1 terminase small subunit [Staphylococcus pseudintermedius]